jgi:hypothetical protein
MNYGAKVHKEGSTISLYCANHRCNGKRASDTHIDFATTQNRAGQEPAGKCVRPLCRRVLSGGPWDFACMGQQTCTPVSWCGCAGADASHSQDAKEEVTLSSY